MSIRAIILGSIAAILIAGFGYINNYVIGLDLLESGYLLPVSVVGTLIIFMITLNPVLHRFRKKWALRPSEIAVVVLMAMISLSIPGRGLMNHFPSVITMPSHWNKLNPGWQENKLLDYVPPEMLVCHGEKDPQAIQDFITGMGSADAPISVKDIPWGKWRRPLQVWLPLIFLMGVATICLSLIVHSQWSTRERLRYPIAEFITTLLKRDPDKGIAPIYRERPFWIGAGLVLFIHLVNGAAVWFDGWDITIPLRFSFGAIGGKWPEYFNYPLAGYLLSPRLYPIVIGFAFFLAADVSFTLGLSQYLLHLVWIPLFAYGIPIRSSYMAGGPMGWHRAGAFVAFAFMLFYTGRRYYWSVIKQAVTFKSRENVEPYAAWACRVLVLCMIAMTTIVIVLGLNWIFAILAFTLMMILFLGVSRIAAETGLFFIHARWMPMGVILGMFGAHAFGPKAMIIVGLLSAVLCLDPSVALISYFANGLKVCSNVGVKPSRAGWLCITAFAGALILATVVTLWANYNYGVPHSYGWNYQRVPTMAFRPTQTEVTLLKIADTLEESENFGSLERILHMNPTKAFLWAAGSGFLLVLIVSFLRLRFSWWPIHPVLFLIIATHPIARFNHSFMIGCILKVVVMKWGGSRIYEKCKPLMIGLIAGDLLGALFFMVAGGIYYLVTGMKPPAYHAFAH